MNHELKSTHDCGEHIVYSGLYDALFCPRCAVWTEQRCSDPSCEFCAVRPDAPPWGIIVRPEG